MIRRWSIARRLFVANVLFVLLLSVVLGTAAIIDARQRTYDDAGRRMQTVAAAVAANPLVLQAAGTVSPSTTLQPYAAKVMAAAGVDFITIMAPDRTRWTHANPAEIGRPYIGTIDPALRGETFTEVTAGTLGPSVRTIVPVKDDGGTVRALVAAGVTVRNVDIAASGRFGAIIALCLALLAAGSLASWLLGRYLRSVTRGWGPEQLAQLFAYYESVLHSVREGVVLIDTRGTVVMYNDQAAELLGLEPSDVGPAAGAAPRLAELPLDASLRELFGSGRTAHDEIHLSDSRILVVNQAPAVGPFRGGRRPAVFGTVATLRDRTEIESLGSELETMRTLSGALRAQTHEHANRLHMIVSLMELGRTGDALDFATKDLELSQRLTDDIVGSVDEPVLSALIMGKSAEAHERGAELTVDVSGDHGLHGLAVQDLVTILGNLLDNALDAAAAAPPPRRVSLAIATTPDDVTFTVADSGPGIDPAIAGDILEYGFSTKAPGPDGGVPGAGGRGVGLALVRQAVKRLDGTLSIDAADDELSGALFRVVLPAPDSTAPDPTKET
ncbi:sensor histidine kinase [Arthrobacter cupressi]|uniref:histidine kinase n=1 Tax=Arthrobacter cupressi TaxID=1045773 RepID=A0A1G8VGS5_9MICC|nr:ATP-binding protein [Arthrobacter cupressi]NYD79449.1 sensor histidine kinase regulating citrate/malate metabolism [Arthrobacter cupressi]SDJ65223.1 Sensor histidine kinase regulating citrate/malate metabolism [Arthrobacter cupressi]